MSIFSMLFGEWEQTHAVFAEAEFSSLLMRKKWTEQTYVTVERHSRTKKERAYILRLNGQKQPTSVGLVKSLIAGVAR